MRSSTFLLLLALVGCAHEPSAVSSSPSARAQPAMAQPAAPTAFRVQVSGHGRPVIFIPDLAASGEVWSSTVMHLRGSAESHVLTVAGFAGVPPVEAPLLPKVQQELARYIRERRLGRVVVVGHMFGAAVAWSLAVAEPDLVAGVVAIDVAPCQSALGEPEEPRENAIAEVSEARQQLAKATPEKFAKMSTRRLASMVVDQARVPQLAEQAGRSTPRAAGDAMFELMSLDLRQAVGSLRAPTLVLVTDLGYPPEDWDGVLAAWHRQIDPIPDHELVTVRGSRHYVMFDQPDAFFAALDRFLAKLP